MCKQKLYYAKLIASDTQQYLELFKFVDILN